MANFWDKVKKYIKQMTVFDMLLLHVMLVALGVFIGALWGIGHLGAALWISIIVLVITALPVEIKFWSFIKNNGKTRW